MLGARSLVCLSPKYTIAHNATSLSGQTIWLKLTLYSSSPGMTVAIWTGDRVCICVRMAHPVT
eukprot:m.157183 g.157183  ORF g.157183 m.157183 type:complete len:63 (+) comp14333_c0_seq1:2104-2292(+)